MSKRYAVVPHPKLKREYKGRLVRTTRVLKNGWGLIPLGAALLQIVGGDKLIIPFC